MNLPPDVRARVQVCQMNWTQPLKDNLALGPRFLRWYAQGATDIMRMLQTGRCLWWNADMFLRSRLLCEANINQDWRMWWCLSDLQRQLETCMAEPNHLEREVKFDLIGVGTAIYSPLVQELLWKEASPELLEVSVSIAKNNIFYHFVVKWKQGLLSWSTHP